jgi:hypothetical protein
LERGREFNTRTPVIPAKAGIQFVTSSPKGCKFRIGARASRPRFIFLFDRLIPSGLRRFAPEFPYWIPAFAGMTGRCAGAGMTGRARN